MTNDTVNQLIESKQFNAAIRSLDASKHVAAAVSTEQAEQLIRHLVSKGMVERAISLAESYLEYHEDDANIYFLLGNAALKLGDVDKAMDALHQANDIRPNHIVTLANLSVGYNAKDQHGEAVKVLEQALRLNPQYAFAYQKLGSILCKAGQVKQGVRSFQRAMMLTPKPHYMFARLLYWRNYLADQDPKMIYADAKVWGQRFTHSFEKGVGVYLNDLSEKKRLKVGFVSPDYCAHPVSFFVEPLFNHLDRDQFAVYAYSDVAKPDAITRSIEGQVDVFRSSVGMNAQVLAKQILDDQIDILFDLAGHTGSGRLDVFHMRPAPVQISWLGYPATTGSAGIDFRLTDRHADPAAVSDPHHTEKLLRVDGGFLCYVPSERTPDAATESPVEKNGYITFGSFNNLAKISEECIEYWSEILHQVPDSKLLIKRRELKDPWVKSYFLHQFEEHGIDQSRLEFKTSQTKLEGHLRQYANVDIALDSFPYNGTTTTFEALWMNTPVISLAGATHASRVGQSILKYAGLGELAVNSVQKYISKSVSLANDKQQLSVYRKTLRSLLADSSLTDQKRFSRSVARLLRHQWIDWVQTQQEEKKIILEDEA
ncbi:MAG: tetratricopeptide repeat protein [Acidiferrobacterales bacterium]|nr:tetratricopeptide repeat protein [Acidiferrobacterales bacterium]